MPTLVRNAGKAILSFNGVDSRFTFLNGEEREVSDEIFAFLANDPSFRARLVGKRPTIELPGQSKRFIKYLLAKPRERMAPPAAESPLETRPTKRRSKRVGDDNQPLLDEALEPDEVEAPEPSKAKTSSIAKLFLKQD